MTTTRSLKALAAQVLAQELEVEQASGTPWNTYREGVEQEYTPRSTDQEGSVFHRPRGGTVEQERDEKDSSLTDAYHRRIDEATSWDDLYAILAEVDVACVNGVISRKEVEALDDHAADRTREIPEHAEQRISDLLARQPVVRVRSRLLGEVVVWVADGTERPEEAGMVYRESELPHLTGRTPTEVRAIHETKRAIDGELVS